MQKSNHKSHVSGIKRLLKSRDLKEYLQVWIDEQIKRLNREISERLSISDTNFKNLD